MSLRQAVLYVSIDGGLADEGAARQLGQLGIRVEDFADEPAARLAVQGEEAIGCGIAEQHASVAVEEEDALAESREDIGRRLGAEGVQV